MTATSSSASVQMPPRPMTSAGTTASVRAATISSIPPGGAISSTRSSAPRASGRERIRSASRTSSGLGLDAERDRPDVGLVLDRRARELQGERPLDALARRERTPRRSAPCGPRAPVRRRREGGPSPRPRSSHSPGLRASGRRARAAISRSRSGLAGARRSSRAQRIAVETPADRGDAVRRELLGDLAVGQLGQGGGHERRGVGAVEALRDARAVCDPRRLGVGGQVLRRVVDHQHLVDARVRPGDLDDLRQKRGLRPDERRVVERVRDGRGVGQELAKRARVVVGAGAAARRRCVRPRRPRCPSRRPSR